MDYAAAMEEDDVLPERLDLVDAVRAEQHGEPALDRDLPDLLEQFEGPDRIHGAGGLVEDQHRRFVQQRAGELKPRAHSRGEREADAVAHIREPDGVQHVRDARGQRVAPQPLQAAAELEVVLARQPQPERAVVPRHEADDSAELGRLPCRVDSDDDGRARRRRE